MGDTIDGNLVLENEDASAVLGVIRGKRTTAGRPPKPALFQNAAMKTSRLKDESYCITFETKDSKGNSAERMRIDGKGNVGIGTINPSAKLEVTTDDSGGGDVIVNGRLKSIGPKHGGGLFVDKKELRFVGNDLKDGIGFNNNGWHLIVNSDGNIGIGTHSPTVKLDVKGDIRINDKQIYFRGDKNHGLGYGFANASIDGPVLYGWSGGALGLSDKQKIALWWTSDGVNIGNKDNFGKLIVQGKGGIHRFLVDGNSGDVVLRDQNNDVTITLQSSKGDIVLSGADCAEEFDIADVNFISPGTVMVINNEGTLSPSLHAYDKRVAGVISGAGEFRPGITLNRREEGSNRLPVALSGKVYCKVDAAYGCVEVGDLLTTSPTQGHAMKVIDYGKAIGTVIGKALRGLTEGQGLIPILVALQ